MYTIMTRQWKKMAPLLCKTLAVWMCVCITTTSAVDSFETCEDLKGLIQIQENETKNTTIMEVESVSCLSIDSPKNLVTAEKSGDTKWVIKLLSTLDLEKTKTKEYTIDFKCCDAGDDRSYSYSLTMAVIGVNDFPPVFSAPNTTISIPESTEVGKIVYEMGTSNPANDPDFGGTNYIVYKVVKGPTDVFDINDNLKGTIQLKQNLDFETNQAYELEISGEEGNTKIKMTATTTLYIKITDVDDLNPRFIDLNYQLQIPEGDYKTIEPNCFLTVPPIKAEDGDRSLDEDISFALAEENDAFSIQENGTLCVQEKIGRGVYFVNIKAMQKNNPEFRLALTVVKLTVTDVNDNPPVIGHAQYKARVSENAAIGSIVLALSATDQDEGDNAEFEFKLEGEESEPFTIETNLNQGVVKTAKVLDRENKDVYKFKVFAQETKTKERRKSKISDVTVSVIDVNDNAPLFAATNNVDILENAPEGTSLIKVTATDKDDGEAGKVTYSLLNSPSSNHFMINNETGEISLKCSDCLNYSETKDITLIVQAQDNGKPPRSSLTSIPVTVVQTKFSAPEFTQSVYSVSVQENDQPKVLMQLRALDPDSLESDLVYSLDPLDNHLISMIKVEQNGQIRSLVSFDAETKSFFKFGVRVSDGHREDNARVEVTVNDVNEFRPKIVMTSLKNISENATIGTVVTYFNVTDKDESNKGFTSAWLDAGSEGKFRLDLNSSSIVTSALLDRKAKSVYTMNIYVSDYGQPPKSSHKELQVVVIDSNTSPVFINENSDPVSSYTFSVNENVSVGFNVGSLRVFDPDNGSSGRIEYHLISVTPSDDFGLDPMSGDLTVKKILNFEKCEVYDITVRARDHSLLPKSIDATVRINIRDVAELPVWPSTNRQVYLTQSEVCNNRNVSHISKWTKEVTVLFAQSDEKIGYYLTNMTSQFSLEETTGLLVNNRKLKAGPYVLGVEACSDNRDSRVCSEAAVTVVVESDSLLTFCQGFYRESVSESKPTGTDILQFTVNKKDDSISYSILRGNDDGSFEVSEETGFLKTAKPLDREKLARYEMVVLAESSSEKAEAQVIIEILDEPDSPPQFSTNHYKAQVPENFASDSEPVLTVTAFDPDQNALISYSLDNDVNGMFKIDQKGHVFVIKSMDYETMAHVYTVTVSATDSIFTTNATVIITVTDVNDESPVFEGLDSTWSVPENVTIPHFMFQVKATDADTNDRIIYSMNMVHPNNTANPFVVHPFSGRLEVRTVLDREQTSDYTLEITAEDTAGHNTTTTVLMSVTDVNDNHPTFGKATFVMNVTEGLSGVGTSLTIQASDDDEGDSANLTFHITSGNEENFFDMKMNGSEIEIKTTKQIAWSPESSEIVLEIIVTDSGSPPKQGKCEVKVVILDGNNNVPVFTSQHYTGAVLETAGQDTPVTMTSELEVVDGDSGKFGKPGVVFSIVERNTMPFRIDSRTGDLFVYYTQASPYFDREKIPSYNITILATDDTGQGLSSNTTIQIDILDVDDTFPYFLGTPYNFSVLDNATFGTGVGTVTANDRDTSSHVIFYTIENPEVLPFVLNYNTGKLSVVSPLDSYNKYRYNLNISASDRLHKTFVDVVVMVIKTATGCPFNSSDSIAMNVSEHQNVSDVFDTINGHGSGNISYTIRDSEWKNVFSVDWSGGLYLLQPVTPFPSNIEFDVLVQSERQGGALPCFIHVKLTVQRDNDFPPEMCSQELCSIESFQFLLTEDARIGTIIGQIHSRDNDTGTDGDVRLGIDAGPDVKDLISIDDNGVLKLRGKVDVSLLKGNGVPDTDSRPSISFNVRAVDGGNPSRSSTATVRVEILPSSDGIPVFDSNSYSVDVEEGKEPGAWVGNISATSAYPITYTLSQSVVDSWPFRINNSTGDIYTTNKLDREQRDVYTFVVVAKETTRNKFSAATQVQVTVIDINDNAPDFTTVDPRVNVDENTLKKNIFRMGAVDADEGDNAEISYRFIRNYPQFSINSTSGEISLVKMLDREAAPSMTLVIEASDSGDPPLNSTTTLTVVIDDVNDKSPTFSSPTFTKNIALENNTDYTQEPILEMNATDDDVGENGNVFYTIRQSGHPLFQITPLTGMIHSIFRDLSIGTYNLTVVATDFGIPPMSSTAIVSILVSSQRTHTPPKIALTPSEVVLFVGMRTGLDLNVTINTHNARTLKLADKDNDGIFSLSADDRVVLSKDLIENTLYSLELVAFNAEGVNVTAVLEVRVLPLHFDQPVYVSHIAENHKVPYTFIDLNSVAERKSLVPVHYTLRTQTDDFKVNSEDGQVTLIHPLDREKVNILTLNVSLALQPDSVGSRTEKSTANDLGSSSTIVSITVYVTDVDDNAPSFVYPGSTLVIPLPANVKPGHEITVLKAFDADDGDNKVIRYSIVSGNHSAISLDQDTGVLTLVDVAGMKRLGRLTLLAQACDAHSGRMCDNITVEITVSEDEFHLIIPISHSDFQENQESIMEQLSSVLDYRLEFIKSNVNKHDGKVDTSRTDIFFRAYKLTTNETVSIKTLSSQVADKQEKINTIFKDFSSVTKASVQDFSNTAVIALLAVAGGMFLASFVAVFIVCRLWRKQKEEQKKVESAHRARKNAELNGGFNNRSDPDEPLELKEYQRPKAKIPYIIITHYSETDLTTMDDTTPEASTGSGEDGGRTGEDSGKEVNGNRSSSNGNGDEKMKETPSNANSRMRQDGERIVTTDRDHGFENVPSKERELLEERAEVEKAKTRHTYENSMMEDDDEKLRNQGYDNSAYETISEIKGKFRDGENSSIYTSDSENEPEVEYFTPLNNFVTEALGSYDDGKSDNEADEKKPEEEECLYSTVDKSRRASKKIKNEDVIIGMPEEGEKKDEEEKKGKKEKEAEKEVEEEEEEAVTHF